MRVGGLEAEEAPKSNDNQKSEYETEKFQKHGSIN